MPIPRRSKDSDARSVPYTAPVGRGFTRCSQTWSSGIQKAWDIPVGVEQLRRGRLEYFEILPGLAVVHLGLLQRRLRLRERARADVDAVEHGHTPAGSPESTGTSRQTATEPVGIHPSATFLQLMTEPSTVHFQSIQMLTADTVMPPYQCPKHLNATAPYQVPDIEVTLDDCNIPPYTTGRRHIYDCPLLRHTNRYMVI